MIKENQKIKIKWGSKNKKYYEGKGYSFTHYGDEFLINVFDLPENSQKEVTILCDCCNKEIDVKYKRYLDAIKKYGKYYCIHCSQMRTLNERQEKIYSEFIDFCNRHNYSPVTKKDDIQSIDDKVTYICPVHGERTITIKTMKKDTECYLCTRYLVNLKWEENLEERQKTLYEKIVNICESNGYVLISDISDIRGYNSYITYSCPKHGEHTVKVGNLINGKKCPKCHWDKIREMYRLDRDTIIKRVHECGGEILNVDDYINQSTVNLLIKCPVCGEPFTTSFQHFIQHGGQACPKCYKKQSVGERKIQDYLDENKIVYIPEYWFPDCRDIKPLPFDFYLPNNEIAIEFDGCQHFRDTKFFNNVYFEKIQYHDQIKDKYCADNGIKLIRIPYWNINKINDILDKELII